MIASIVPLPWEIIALCRISTIISAASETANKARHNSFAFWER
ncbi:hypothetical protein GCWU000341_02753 [Oribacterium sp. oral taxon 078 str. F0262]|nr:hypothetical protein GCWU000341_02753 [Oribacterium sp. oral taxon 078 str. F0262]